eukprot:GHVT01075236.1.p5 GENE.GHVT01075236.1~~GHVT01075236.1.p5  ORF type:complete len:107 (-),score=18.38 GHVT01075236.1:1684-2004(-)
MFQTAAAKPLGLLLKQLLNTTTKRFITTIVSSGRSSRSSCSSSTSGKISCSSSSSRTASSQLYHRVAAGEGQVSNGKGKKEAPLLAGQTAMRRSRLPNNAASPLLS